MPAETAGSVQQLGETGAASTENRVIFLHLSKWLFTFLGPEHLKKKGLFVGGSEEGRVGLPFRPRSHFGVYLAAAPAQARKNGAHSSP